MAATALVGTACNDDGREMREPTPDQSLSIMATTDTAGLSIGDGLGEDSGADLGAGDLGSTGDPNAMGHDDGSPTAPGFDVTLPWADGDQIPRRFTCDGAGVSPAIEWTGVPDGTVEIAIVVRTLDAAETVQWLVAGITPEPPRVREGARLRDALVAMNGVGVVGWTPPCADDGTNLLVRFEVHALAQQVEALRGDPAADMLALVDAATIATTTGIGIAIG